MLERYSRINAILKSLQTALAPSKWKDTFVTNRSGPYSSTKITMDMSPSWMQPENQTDVLVDLVATPQRPRFAKKEFNLRLDRSTKTKIGKEFEDHVRNHIEYNSLRLPDDPVQPNRDPRIYPNSAMWRDTIRRQLDFPKLCVDFLAIEVVNNTTQNGTNTLSRLSTYLSFDYRAYLQRTACLSRAWTKFVCKSGFFMGGVVELRPSAVGIP